MQFSLYSAIYKSLHDDMTYSEDWILSCPDVLSCMQT